jgi:predicted nucleotidyltransferase component of viral defense system
MGKPSRESDDVRPLHARLQEARSDSGLPWEVVERDYLLSWLLAGITQVPSLRDTIVFKGGTALKKCYFGSYRFSEDLDFSAVHGAPVGDAMEQAVRETSEVAARLVDEYAPVEIVSERYAEREPHPAGQETFVVRARFPWQRRPQTRVLIEITMDEKVLLPVPKRPISHEYGEPLDTKVRVYSLEEIVAEKLRAILQHAAKLEERGWSRSRARDYYDIWRVLGTYSNQMDLADFITLLREKCAARGVGFDGADDFFQEHVLNYVEKTWDQWLGTLVPNLPAYGTVMSELRPMVEAIIPAGRR